MRKRRASGEVDQDAFPQPVLAHHAPCGVQFFHHATKDERTRGNDSFAARFQAGNPDAGRLRFAEHVALDTLNHRKLQHVILNSRGIIGGEPLGNSRQRGDRACGAYKGQLRDVSDLPLSIYW